VQVGKSLVEDDRVDMARALLKRGGDKLVLPVDALVAASLDQPKGAHVVNRDAIPAAEGMFDIGTRSEQEFARIIGSAGTIVWNGPMGVFETPPFDSGTRAVAKAMAEATKRGATTIVGGGDSAAAVAELGLEDRMSHVSTGGGASLEFLEGKELPGVSALDDA
jgi:phosphoglycerate kinase